MFYSVHILGPAEDGAPLRLCWLASHGRKPAKQDLAAFSIPEAARLIQEPEVALSLRYVAKVPLGRQYACVGATCERACVSAH